MFKSWQTHGFSDIRIVMKTPLVDSVRFCWAFTLFNLATASLVATAYLYRASWEVTSYSLLARKLLHHDRGRCRPHHRAAAWRHAKFHVSLKIAFVAIQEDEALLQH